MIELCTPCGALQHLRRIRTSTRAEVHVDAKVHNVEERVVVCKSQEPADSQWCGAAEALVKCTQHMLHDKVGLVYACMHWWCGAAEALMKYTQHMLHEEVRLRTCVCLSALVLSILSYFAMLR